MFRFLLAATLVLSHSFPAAAASSGWTRSAGAEVRIVTSGLSDEAGRLRGALEIRLKSGWKTYWRNPGESGIPPQIELSPAADATAVQLHFPAPERMSDRYATWIGYKRTVALPVVFTFPAPRSGGIVEGTASLGICDTICVPVDVPFSFDAGADPDNPLDAMAVSAAFAALPRSAHDGFRVERVERKGEQLVFHAELPEGSGEAELFVAPVQEMQIVPPKLERHDGAMTIFTAEVVQSPNADESALQFHYTLVTGNDAVDGTLVLR